jgi:hypothetical protein
VYLLPGCHLHILSQQKQYFLPPKLGEWVRFQYSEVIVFKSGWALLGMAGCSHWRSRMVSGNCLESCSLQFPLTRNDIFPLRGPKLRRTSFWSDLSHHDFRHFYLDPWGS